MHSFLLEIISWYELKKKSWDICYIWSRIDKDQVIIKIEDLILKIFID